VSELVAQRGEGALAPGRDRVADFRERDRRPLRTRERANVGREPILQVAGLLHERGIPVSDPAPHDARVERSLARWATKLWYAGRALLRHPGHAASWIRLIVRSRQRHLGDAWTVLVNWLYLLDRVGHHRTSPGVYVMDQGLFQALWSLAYGAGTSVIPTAAVLKELRAVLPGRCVVVLVEAGCGAALARLRQRRVGWSRLQHDLTAGDVNAPVTAAAAALWQVEQVAVDLAAHHRIRLLRVRNDDVAELPTAAAALVATLSETLRLEPLQPV